VGLTFVAAIGALDVVPRSCWLILGTRELLFCKVTWILADYGWFDIEPTWDPVSWAIGSIVPLACGPFVVDIWGFWFGVTPGAMSAGVSPIPSVRIASVMASLVLRAWSNFNTSVIYFDQYSIPHYHLAMKWGYHPMNHWSRVRKPLPLARRCGPLSNSEAGIRHKSKSKI
jgi:hypothetical protein